MKRVLIVGLSDLRRDMRIRRHIFALKDEYDVTAVGNCDPVIEGVRFIPSGFHEKTPAERVAIYSLYLLRRFEAAYWTPKWLRVLRDVLAGEEKYDIVLANDTDTLPLACALGSRYGVVFDAHEYSPKEFEDSFLWRLLFMHFRDYLCRVYIPKTAACFTVAVGIAQEYERCYGHAFSVLTNAPDYIDLPVGKVQSDVLHMVHHGAALPSRGIEGMIDVMRYTDDRFKLHFYLVGEAKYIGKLKALAKGNPNIVFHAPVKAADIARHMNGYDIGLYLLKGANFNEKHSLPNKFFEFAQARLALAIGPSVEMAPYVEKYGCGIVSDTFDASDMAERLNALDAEKVEAFKHHSARMAEENNSKANGELLRAVVKEVLERG